MGRHLRAALKWGSIAAVPLTLVSLWVWNPHGDMPAHTKIIGMFLAYPFLYTAFELRPYVPSAWLILPIAAVAQLIWCAVLALPICVVVSWIPQKRSPSNNAMDSDTVRSPLRAPPGARHRER